VSRRFSPAFSRFASPTWAGEWVVLFRCCSPALLMVGELAGVTGFSREALSRLLSPTTSSRLVSSTGAGEGGRLSCSPADVGAGERSEEHTSELQSRENPVCSLLL